METPITRQNKVPVYLSVYDWHLLLRLIEDTLKFSNQGDMFQHNERLYGLIASQLYGKPIGVKHE